MAKSLSDFPEGMITEIFLRLPVKPLLCCKSVCKPWLSIISNSHFIKSHLHRAIVSSWNNPTLINFEFPSQNEEEERRYLEQSVTTFFPVQQQRLQFIDKALLDANGQDLSSSPIHFDFLVMPRLFESTEAISNCCNGIIFLNNTCGDASHLWNPSIRKCKKIPAPTQYSSIYVNHIGFGYDSISNDYKVIKIVADQMNKFFPIVQVYSTNANCWKEFRPPISGKLTDLPESIIVVNGILYVDRITGDIISFDLRKEVFGLVPLPSFVQRKRSDLLDFRGLVAMVFDSGSGVDLWTLDDVSDEVSWSKQFRIIEADLETEIWLYEYLGAGQFYGSKSLHGNFFLYNILYDYEKGETKYYAPEKRNANLVHKFIESLVSLDGFEQVE